MNIKKGIFLWLFVVLSLCSLEVKAQLRANKIEKTISISNIPKEIEDWIKSEFAKKNKKPIYDFNGAGFYNTHNGKLIGYIKGFDASLKFSTGIINLSNEIISQDLPTVIQIYPDGRFEADFPLAFPICTNAIINDVWIPFYLEPEQTLAIILDYKDLMHNKENVKFRNVAYKGALEQINTELLNFDYNKRDYEDIQRKIESLSADEFKNYQLAEQKENLAKFDLYIKNHTVSTKAVTIVKNDIYLSTAANLFMFAEMKNRALMNDNPSKTTSSLIPASYYNFLKELPLNDQSLAVSSVFGEFINNLQFCQPFRVEPNRKTFIVRPTKKILEYFDEQGIAVLQEDRDLCNKVLNDPFKLDKVELEKYNAKIAQFKEKYKEQIAEYQQKYVNPLFKGNSINVVKEYWRLKDSVALNVLGLQKNLVYDITKIRSLEFDIERAEQKNASQYWEGLQKEISNPFLIEEGNNVFYKVFPSENAISHVLPLGKATTIFNTIINPFKGKVLFVDFWSTTCAPCVENIKNMREIRKKYEGNKDFEFLFITEETESPLASYSKFIKSEELKNSFRLSGDDYNYLRQLFKFSGIPKYVVIDRKGNVLYDNFQMHNFEFELTSILDLTK